MPNGCEDFTGDRPLQERIDIIKDADFFIGLNSGLSWLAWCCEIPVVVISGICADFGEFFTPYRVCARHVCHGCWNDTRYEFDHGDYMWCPKHKGTNRAYECTKCISAKQVIDTIDRIPGILKHDGRQEDMA
jgi:autotransporter strand-loop-strand O-heptosyltransferase